MKQNIYVIRDTVSEQITPLFCCPNDEMAKREFNQFIAACEKNPGIAYSVSDCCLVRIGRLDTETLTLDPQPNLVLAVGSGIATASVPTPQAVDEE